MTFSRFLLAHRTIMTIATKQLEDIHQELQANFSNHDVISIEPVGDSPYEKYNVIFHQKGMHKDSVGEISLQDKHIISIAIPFGYPHFPPSCTPQSPVFHPDFDPDAICIGEFWNEKKQLSDLVLYIGQMISGQLYSTENTFNEEAAKWYQSHNDQLPFDTLDDTLAPTSSEEDVPSIGEIEDQVDELELDVIGADDLESDVESYLSVDSFDEPEQGLDLSDEDTLFENEPPPQQDEDEVDIDFMLFLKGKKRFYGLNELLSQLPESTQFDQKQDLDALVDQKIGETQHLFGEAETLEQNGDTTAALAKYKEIKNLVADFPDIDNHIDRLSQIIKGSEPKQEKADSDKKKSTTTPASLNKKNGNTVKRNKNGVTFYVDKDKKKMGLLPPVLGAAAVIFVATIGYFFFTASGKLSEGEEKLLQCRQAIKVGKFKEADQYCIEALSTVKQITLFQNSAKKELIKQIEKELKSEKLKEGLAGKISYEGNFITKKSFNEIKQYQKLIKNGKQNFEKHKWQKAFTDFESACNLSAANKDIDKSNLDEIQLLMARASFNFSYDAGKQYVEQKNWSLAAQQLGVAQEALKQLDQESRHRYTEEIDKLLSQGRYYTLKNQADTFFESSNWPESIKGYQTVLHKADIFLNEHPEKEKHIKEQLAKSTLYGTVQSGKIAFSKGEWDNAISLYDKAISLLNENRDMLKQVGSQKNRNKLARIKLQASIIRDNQETARNLKAGAYTKAIKQLNSIIKTISSSPFSSDEEFTEVVAEAKKSIAKAQHDRFINGRISYLEENYKDIFSKNNPALNKDYLFDPHMTYLKRKGNSYLFKLQCTEKGRGRPLKLVMQYLYNPSTKKWTFYTE